MIENDIVVIISRQDPAGMNMLTYLVENYQFDEYPLEVPVTWPNGGYRYLVGDQISIVIIPGSQIFTDYLMGYVEADLLIFASKHSSGAGKKALLVHTTGIWQEEQGHGGNDYEIAYAPADVLSYAYERIKFHQEQADLDYWTGIECTHHGPSSLTIPVAYFETGGTAAEWNDEKACAVVAKVILETAVAFLEDRIPRKMAFIGIGGNHYCSRFIKILDQGELSPGHIIPKYALTDLPTSMLDQAYEKTVAEDKLFLIDKKGARASERNTVIEYLERKGYPWEYA